MTGVSYEFGVNLDGADFTDAIVSSANELTEEQFQAIVDSNTP